MKVRKAAWALALWLLLAPASPGAASDPEDGQKPGSETEAGLKDRAGSRLLSAAWEQYRAGNYEKSAEFFRLASQVDDPDQKNEAGLGLGYTLQRMGKAAEAEAVFKELWAAGYDPTRSGPALVGLYLEQGRLDEAETIVAGLPVQVREEWVERLTQARAGRETQVADQNLQQAWDALSEKNFNRAEELFQAAAESLPEDRKKEARLGLAYAAWGQGRLVRARSLFEDLLREGYKTDQIRKDLVKLLLNQNEIQAARTLMQELSPEEREAFSDDLAEARRRQRELRLEALFESLDRTESPTAKRKLALEILNLDPGNQDVLAVLGWACRDLKNYDCALGVFKRLFQSNPSQDNLLGLTYTLADLGREEEAISLLESRSGRLPAEARELLAGLYLKSAGELYEKEDFEAAEKRLRLALKYKPGDREARELLGWTLYKQGRADEALEIFRELFDQSRGRRDAENLLGVLDQEGRDREALDFAAVLAEEKTRPDLLRLAADRYADQGWHITAAQTLSDPGTCYYNFDKPWLEVSPYYGFRDGDEGTSQLSRFVWPVFLHYPFSKGKLLSFGLVAAALDSGQAQASPYAGSYYRRLDDPNLAEGDLITQRSVWRPVLAYEQEGLIRRSFALGLTPLGGPVAPAPTFDFQLAQEDSWRIRLSQCAVEDSLLSLIGQEDPYSDREWGRVVRTALEAEKTFDLGDSYWVTLKADYGYLWGENTEDNHSAAGTVSFGRSRPLGPGDLACGVFATVEHFENNQDFYTYGHGGYFSPEFFVMAGPFINWKSRPCRDYLFNLEASLGYMQYQTADAPKYREKGDLPLPASAPALADYSGFYQGEEENGLGLSLKTEVGKLISPHVALGGRAGLEASSSYTELQAGVWLHFYFEPHRAIFPNFSGFRPCP